MKRLLLLAILLLNPFALYAQVSINPGMTQAQIQTAINGSAPGNTITFAAGNYGGWSGSYGELINCSGGRIYTGPANSAGITFVNNQAVQQTSASPAVLNSDNNLAGDSIFSIQGGSGGSPGAACTIQNLTFKFRGALLAGGDCSSNNASSGILFQNNTIYGLTDTGGCSGTGLLWHNVSNSKIFQNYIGPNCQDTINGFNAGGSCGALSIGQDDSNITVDSNIIDTTEEGEGSGGLDTSGSSNITFSNNIFRHVHRIAFEITNGSPSGSGNVDNFQVNGNILIDPYNPWALTFAVSMACCNNLTPPSGHSYAITNNVWAGNATPSGHFGYGMEQTGGKGTIYNYNLLQGNWVGTDNGTTGIAIGDLTDNTKAIDDSHNVVQGAHFTPSSFIGCEYGGSFPTCNTNYDGAITWPITSTPMTTGGTPTQQVTATPSVSPGSGTFVSPPTVTLTDNQPSQQPATIFYTTDGSTPTTASTVYTAPFACVSLPCTVRAIAQWGKGAAQAYAFPAGYGWGPSGTAAATYSSAGAGVPISINDGTVIVANPSKFGMNLGTPTPYESGQRRKNLWCNNFDCGFELGEKTQIWQIQTGASPLSTTQINSNINDSDFDQVTVNFWNGGSIKVVNPGAAPGSEIIGSSTITANTVAGSSPRGPVFTFSPAIAAPATNQNFFIVHKDHVVVQMQGGCTGSGTCTLQTSDLCASCGTQTLKIDATAGDTTYYGVFDNTAQNEFVLVNGGTWTHSGEAKCLVSSCTVTATVLRGSTPLCTGSTTVTSGSGWGLRTINTCTPSETGSGTVQALTLQIKVTSGGVLLFDNPDFEQTSGNDVTNTSIYRDAFVSEMKDWYQNSATVGQGTCRYGPHPADSTAASLTGNNYFTVPVTQPGQNHYTDLSLQPDLFQDFFQFAKVVGCQPYIIFPITWGVSDTQTFVHWLKTSGWYNQFTHIYLEHGNENWNQGTFAGFALGFNNGISPDNVYTQLFQWSHTIWTAARTQATTDGITSLVYMDGILTGDNPSSAVVATANPDVIEVNGYTMDGMVDCSTTTNCWLPAMTEPYNMTHDNSSVSGFKQSWNAISSYNVCGAAGNVQCQLWTYEQNNQAVFNANPPTQVQLDGFWAAGGTGIITAQQLMQNLQLGLTQQNFYAASQYLYGANGFNAHIFAMNVDFGGATNSIRRPSHLGGALANQAVIGPMVQTVLTSPDACNLGSALNGVNATNAPCEFAYAFKQGNHRAVLLINTDLTASHTVSFTGTGSPINGSTVTRYRLAPTNLSDKNEASNNNPTNTTPATVSVSTSTLTSFNPTAAYVLPPHEVELLTYDFGPTVSITIPQTSSTPNASLVFPGSQRAAYVNIANGTLNTETWSCTTTGGASAGVAPPGGQPPMICPGSSPAPTGTIYYVSPTGNDSNPGSIAQPWLTPAHASSVAVGGNTVLFMDGTYNLPVGDFHGDWSITSTGGTAGSPVTFRSLNKYGAHLVGAGPIAVVGFSAPYIILQDFDITGVDANGVIMNVTSTASNTTVQGNYIHDMTNIPCNSNSGAGITSGSDYTTSHNNAYANLIVNMIPVGGGGCTTHYAGGIDLMTPFSTAANNIVINSGDAIEGWHAASNMVFYGNVVINNHRGISNGAGDAPGGIVNHNSLIENNIVYNSSAEAIVETGVNGATLNNQYNYNDVFLGTTISLNGTSGSTQTGNITTDPLFVNNTGTAAGNYRLQSGSSARGAGLALAGILTDFANTPRPQTGTSDLGAYVFIVPTVTTGAGYVKVTFGTGSGTCTKAAAGPVYTINAGATVTVTATSVDDVTKSSSITYDVCNQAVSASVMPFYRVLYSGQKALVTGIVNGTSNYQGTWSIITNPGDASLSDTTNRDTVFTATIAGQYKIRFTSTADPTKTADAILYVTGHAMPRNVQPNGTEPVDCTVDPNMTGPTLDVGSGQPFPNLEAINPLTMAAGTTVRLHSGTYPEWIQINNQGTPSQPIRYVGCPDGSGNLPVMEGAHATARSDIQSPSFVSGSAGIFVYGPNFNLYPTYTSPTNIIVEGIKFHGYNSGNTFCPAGSGSGLGTCSVAEVAYGAGASGFRFQSCTDCEAIGLEAANNGNGLFSESNTNSKLWNGISRRILWEGVNTHDNGITGDFQEHNYYLQAWDEIVQFSQTPSYNAAALGSMTKIRSNRPIYRYNYNGCGAQTQLDITSIQDWTDYSDPVTYLNATQVNYPADAFSATSLTDAQETWHHQWIYGNVFSCAMGTSIHFAGDEPGYEQRVGPFDFHNNTFNAQTSGVFRYYWFQSGDNGNNITHYEWPQIWAYNNSGWNWADNTNPYFYWGGQREAEYNFGINQMPTLWGTNVQTCTNNSGGACDGTGWPFANNTDAYTGGINLPGHLFGVSSFVTTGSAPWNLTTYIPNSLVAGGALPTTMTGLPIRFQYLPASGYPVSRNTTVTTTVGGFLGALDKTAGPRTDIWQGVKFKGAKIQ